MWDQEKNIFGSALAKRIYFEPPYHATIFPDPNEQQSHIDPCPPFCHSLPELPVPTVSDGKGQDQPACQEDWKICRKKRRIVMLM
jgi:hypothetical protein